MYFKNPNNVKMEQEDCGGSIPYNPIGFNKSSNSVIKKLPTEVGEAIKKLSAERELIINNEKYTHKQKVRLLELNQKALIVLSGGTIKKTDNVIYGILIFGGITIIALSLLNVFANLSTEITMAFIGTTMGGVIASISQKLGKLS